MNATWLNGAPLAEPLVTHRGLHYGDGVFRTCLIFDGVVVEFEAQLAKLTRDAARLELAADAAALRAEARAAAQGIGRGALKLLLLRAGGERGYRSQARDADRLLCRYPLPQYQASPGARAARANFQLASQPRLAGIKHLNRLEQVLAARNWPEGIDEIVLEDEQGHPVSGSRSNLFWVRGGVLHTPPVDRCGVAGLTRERVLALAEQGGLKTRVTATTFEEIGQADELFFCNSLFGIWPARALGARAFAAPGPVTRHLTASLRHPLAGTP